LKVVEGVCEVGLIGRVRIGVESLIELVLVLGVGGSRELCC
jgi:hypothetical protein